MRLREMEILVKQLSQGGSGLGSLPGGFSVEPPDQTVVIPEADTLPDQNPNPDGAVDVMDLGTIEGPGMFAVVLWGEVNPADDLDYVQVATPFVDEVSEQPGANNLFTRFEALPGQIGVGGWLGVTLMEAAFALAPGYGRQYSLRMRGWAYNEADPPDRSAAPSGPVQIRNFYAAAIRLA